MIDKSTAGAFLIIFLIIILVAVALPKKHIPMERVSYQTDINKINYDALSSMVNVQNARLVKANVVLQQQILDSVKRNAQILELVLKLQEYISQYKARVEFVEQDFRLQLEDLKNQIVELEDSELLKEVARLQELVINQEEKIHNLEIRDNIFQAKFEEICKFLSYVADKLKEETKIDIRCYKFHRPGCN